MHVYDRPASFAKIVERYYELKLTSEPLMGLSHFSTNICTAAQLWMVSPKLFLILRRDVYKGPVYQRRACFHLVVVRDLKVHDPCYYKVDMHSFFLV